MKKSSAVINRVAPRRQGTLARGFLRSRTVPPTAEISSRTWKTPFRRPLHPSYCFYATVWGIITGIALALACHLILPSPLLFLATALFLVSLFHPSLVFLPLAFSAGCLFGACRTAPLLADQAYLSQFVGQTVIITGSLASDPDDTTVHLSDLRLAREAPVENSQETVEKTVENLANNPVENPETAPVTALTGTLYVQLSKPPGDLIRSDLLTVRGKLGAGFGTFAGSLYRPEVLALEKLDPGDLPAKFQHFFSNLVKQQIPEPESALGLGYLMGQKSGLSSEFEDRLRAVGMTHVIVASGAHLGILVAATKKLFGRLSKFAGLLFATLTIFAFASIVGFTPSMTRAALVTILSLFFGYVGRQFTPVRLLSFTAAVTLLISPLNLFSLGWQLSFASFAGILLVAPLFTRFLYGGKSPPWLASMLLTSLGTCLACAPILIYNFGTISLLGFVANLVILPTLPYAMLLVLCSGVFSFLPFLAAIIARLATWLLDLHIWLVNFLSDKFAFILEFTPQNPWIYLCYLPLLAIIAVMCYNEKHDRTLRSRNACPRPTARDAP